MKRPILTKLLCFVMSLLMLSCTCMTVMAADEESDVLLIAPAPDSAEADEDSNDSGKKTSLEEIREVLNADSYKEYLEKMLEIADNASDTYVFKASEVLDKDNSVKGAEVASVTYTDVNGASVDVKVVTMPDDGFVYFVIDVPKSGLYTIEAEYYADGTAVDSDSTIERSFTIDGKLPFSEARSIEFMRAWKDVYLLDENGNIKLDENGNPAFKRDISKRDKDGNVIDGNDIRFSKEQLENTLISKLFSDSTGYISEPFRFYFSEGQHVLGFEAVRETMQLHTITLAPITENISYEDYVAKFEGKTNDAKSEIYIDAEYPTATSDKSIYALNDRSSAITFPQNPSLTRNNTIGGSKWQEVGQWVSYVIEVPEDGWYNISTRFKQGTMEGLFTSRRLLIDGEVPFAEADQLRFNYDRQWQLEYFTDTNGKPYEFYLTKGPHEIRLEVVLGEMSDILSRVSATNNNINEMYLDILMLTGSEPDAYIDYEFIKNLPDVVRGLREESQNLYNVAADLTEIVGQAGSNTATLEKTAYLCKKIGYDADLIARNLDRLKSDIGTIGTWIQTASKQPLTLDYILISPASAQRSKEYKANANFLESLAFEFESFIMSFFTDYTSIGMTVDIENMDENDVVEVWYAVDRDRAGVIRQMIDNDFTPNTGVPINFKLVAGGSLLPSILSGVGPDVMIGLGSSDVINYSIRSAIKSVNDLPGYEEIAKEFREEAMVPLTLYDKVYGLPMTMNFPMLYYRADVLLKLGLEIPNTWDDFYDMIPAILANKLDIAYPVGEQGLYLFLFQTGENLYKTHEIQNSDGSISTLGGLQINLDSNTALSCFKKMCDLITLYDLPLSYSFPNRFRTGEMPIGIQDIGLYNELTLFAPEIAGLWGMVAVPGTELDDGTVDYSSPVGVTATVLIKNDDPEYDYTGAWEFVKWWSGHEVQGEFGSEVVALMGDGAKYFTANTLALESLPWTKNEYDNIMYQFNMLSAKPEMPGGYIITRYVTFAYQAVYNERKDAVNEIQSYVDEINAELTRKRMEFELSVIDDFTENENGVLVPNEEGLMVAPDGRLYTVEEYNKLFGN